jgi:hypothetical protein
MSALIGALALGGALLGCGDDGSSGHTSDAGAAATSGCEAVAAISAGTTVAADDGTFSVRVIRTNPSPLRKFENEWVVEIIDADGQPIPNADLTEVGSWMPVHQHPAGVDAKIESDGAPGTFKVSPIYLWMSGTWEVTFHVRVGDTEDKAMFIACIDG